MAFLNDQARAGLRKIMQMGKKALELVFKNDWACFFENVDGKLKNKWLSMQQPGPSRIKNFNPGIFRDRILPNPGIPGCFGTGFTLIKSEKYFC